MEDKGLRRQVNLTCALYAALTVVCLAVLQNFSWAPVQVRLSESLCAVALFSRGAAPRLAAGCAAANFIGIWMFGLWPLGMLDVAFGSLATFLGALWCHRFRDRPARALFGFVLANALIVAAYLPLVAQGSGFYTVPFLGLALDGNCLAMYAFGVVSIGVGEAASVYALGWPLSRFLKRKLERG